MKIKIKFSNLDKLITKMPTTEKKWSSSKESDLNDRDASLLQSREGLKIDGEEILKTERGKFFFKGNKQFIVFIHDHTKHTENEIRKNPTESTNRYHIIACRTILEMVQKNRFSKRYQHTTNTTGLFKIFAGKRKWFARETVTIDDGKLFICKNCIRELQDNYQEISKNIDFDFLSIGKYPFRRMSTDHWGSFDIGQLFSFNKQTFIHRRPDYSERDAPNPSYTKDFDTIKKKLKMRKNYTCEECGLDCSSFGYRDLIDCNHKDGAKFNNAIKNLEILCVDCHSKRPNHSHYINIARDRVERCIQLKEIKNIS